MPPEDPTTRPPSSTPDAESDRELPEPRDIDEDPYDIPYVNPIATGADVIFGGL
jgi:hypothetical protein